MEIVIGGITEVVKYLVSPFMDNISYLIHYKRNSNDLKNEMARLGEMEEDVQRSVDAARLRGDVIKVVVESWLTRVKEKQNEETTLHNSLEESKGCPQRGCSLRYRVGKDAKRMIDEVKKLLIEGQTFVSVSDPSPLPPGPESMQTLDFQVYESTKSAMDKIMKALKDQNIKMVGVYGIGGVGKTTLMRELAKKLKKDGHFDQVVMVTVSQEPVFKKIQGEIAENLGLPLTEESLDVRARRLIDRLRKEKRILIVLDDLWKRLDLLQEVGIPCGNNCKVVLTTRQLQVCSQMETQINVEVKVLSEGDAWSLFKWASGDCVENDNTLHAVAKEIVRECGGLPIAIITIGRALRRKDRYVWEDAASQLKKSNSSPPDIEGVNEKVFHSIKLSYLPEDFSISEDDLLPHVIGEGVFGDIKTLVESRNRLHMHLERLKASCLLLDADSEREEGCVKMHDVIRDVSIWIASQQGRDFVIKSGRGLTDLPEEDMEKLRKCKRLSLMQNKITKLPNRLEEYCSNQLTTLSLRHNLRLTEIPDGFFQGMLSLKNLDLRETRISTMPSSLSCLTDIRVLCVCPDLHYSQPEGFDISLVGKLKKLEILCLICRNVKRLGEEIGELTNLKWLDLSRNHKIVDVSVVGRLKKLEILNLSRCQIEKLGEEIGELTNLKSMDLSRNHQIVDVSVLGKLKKLEILRLIGCNVEKLGEEIGELTNLKSLDLSENRDLIIAPNTLSRMCLLEKLNLEFSFHEWGMEEGSEEEEEDDDRGISKEKKKKKKKKVCCCLSEVASLSALTTLRIEVSNIKCLSANNNIPCRWENLTSFQVILGNGDWDTEKYAHLSSECATGMTIYEAIFNPNPLSDWFFLLLERTEGLQLGECRGLKYGLSSLIGAGGRRRSCLNKLRKLWVRNCDDVEYIVCDDDDDLPFSSSNLEKLYLQSLRKLNAICCCCRQYGGSSLLRPGPSGGGGGGGYYGFFFNNLRYLEVFGCNSIISIIPSDLLANLPNLEELEVDSCRNATEGSNMKFMFSLAMAQRFQQLQQIEIRFCPNMVQIINPLLMEGDDEINTQRQLNYSSTNNNHPLPSSSSSLSVLLPSTSPPIFGNLRLLHLKSCDRLKHILPMSLAQAAGFLQQLEELIIHSCSHLKEIILNDQKEEEEEEAIIMSKKKKKKTPVVLFPRLRYLFLYNLPNLSMVVSRKGELLLRSSSHDYYSYWPSLETLEVWKCPNLKRLPVSPQTMMTATKLKEIVVQKQWFNALEWDDDDDDHDNKLQHLQQSGVKVTLERPIEPWTRDRPYSEEEDNEEDVTEEEDEEGDVAEEDDEEGDED
ncbi:LOW QUALITY PROTEIN: putative disease resistance protein At1g63350 [Telopea speciosissima]|uniref:LOW QUALITY PROTEIN: putative disease resistance protein At1g63350 n=1 Tax=Telopea speciosissima TaxID=54955 RepID=UPI001CC60CD3|nr:LOW QUALITY PROTEIN: putative disease resistance protein At1g63350 [Telopea speciosissima]